MTVRQNSVRHSLLPGLSIIGCILTAILLLLTANQLSAQGETRPRSPRYCGRCHEEEYAHWRDSAHNLEAFQGERFQSVWDRQRRSSECLACHTTQLGEGDDAVTYNGVTCAACHVAVDDTYDPDEREHVMMSIPKSSESCAGCHGGDHALTYLEWENSAHNGPREVGCLDCHDAHTGDTVQNDISALCGSCHMQPVPTVSAHMHINSGCTDCHPASVKTDNVHMGGSDPAECTDCHMVIEMEEWGRYLENAGHSMTVSLAACTNCHGSLHEMQ
nr:hypothetical protein [Anaerolineae bacterium]